MKINYLSTSRLPTQKAYGVTIFESVRAAKKLGIDLAIYSPGSRDLQIPEGVIHLPSVKLPSSLGGFKLARIRKMLFGINSLLIPLVALANTEFRDSRYVWLRDPLSALVLSVIKPDKEILLEIHHRPRGMGIVLLRILARARNLHFSAISPRLLSQISNDCPGINIFESPMAVPTDFFISRGLESSKKFLRLLYIGKGQSSGFDNGLLQLVHDFSRALKVIPHQTLTFVGLEEDYKSSLSELRDDYSIPPDKIEFVNHVPHHRVKDFLAKHNVGVLPYPESTYNNERFPIKSLEYAASELAIIASRIESHIEILGSEKAYFYEPEVPASFESAISEIFSDLALRKEKIGNAKNWSEGFTYEMRIKGVMGNWLGVIF